MPFFSFNLWLKYPNAHPPSTENFRPFCAFSWLILLCVLSLLVAIRLPFPLCSFSAFSWLIPPYAPKFNHTRKCFGRNSNFSKNFNSLFYNHLGDFRFWCCAKIQRKCARRSNSRGTLYSPIARPNPEPAEGPLLENQINSSEAKTPDSDLGPRKRVTSHQSRAKKDAHLYKQTQFTFLIFTF